MVTYMTDSLPELRKWIQWRGDGTRGSRLPWKCACSVLLVTEILGDDMNPKSAYGSYTSRAVLAIGGLAIWGP